MAGLDASEKCIEWRRHDVSYAQRRHTDKDDLVAERVQRHVSVTTSTAEMNGNVLLEPR